MTKASEPPILTKTKRRLFSGAASEAAVAGTSSLLSAVSKAAERAPMHPIELLRHLHLKLHEADSAAQRSKWFGGRLFNALGGQRGDYVELSPWHLVQTLNVTGDLAPPDLSTDSQYLLRVDIARSAYERLRQEHG